MSKYFAHLRPMERRLAVAVMVVLFIVLNLVFVYPHFSDWNDLQARRAAAEQKLNNYDKVISQSKAYQKLINDMQSSGAVVLPEDQGINFTRTIQTQSSASGVAILNTSRQITKTNDQFFVEQVLNVNVQATDPQLVDFLYKLGSGDSMIRVIDMELQPDPPRQHLTANIRLVASYQKNPPAKPGTAKPGTVKAK